MPNWNYGECFVCKGQRRHPFTGLPRSETDKGRHCLRNFGGKTDITPIQGMPLCENCYRVIDKTVLGPNRRYESMLTPGAILNWDQVCSELLDIFHGYRVPYGVSRETSETQATPMVRLESVLEPSYDRCQRPSCGFVYPYGEGPRFCKACAQWEYMAK